MYMKMNKYNLGLYYFQKAQQLIQNQQQSENHYSQVIQVNL